MSVYYHDERCTIHCGNALEELPHMQSVSAVITDPPYGLDFAEWDGQIPNWLPLAQAIAPIVAFTTAPTTQWTYPKPDWVACWYRPASSSRTYTGGFNHWSPVLIYGNHRIAVDCINLHAIANAYPPGFEHPSPKPEALMEWLVDSLVAESCLDPFMGSGTTAVACIRAGKKFTGIEVNESYCNLAVRRIRKAYNDMALLSPPPEAFVTPELFQ